jgi:hypothetical protein
VNIFLLFQSHYPTYRAGQVAFKYKNAGFAKVQEMRVIRPRKGGLVEFSHKLKVTYPFNSIFVFKYSNVRTYGRL